MAISHSIIAPRGRDYALLMLCATLLASSFAAIKYATKSFDALEIATFRCVTAFILLGLRDRMIAGRHPAKPVASKTWRYPAALGVLGYALPFFLVAFAETQLSSGHTAILFTSGPIFAILFGWLLTADERPHLARLFGMALATVGVVLAVITPNKGDVQEAWSYLPAAAVIAAAASYALGGNLSRRCPMHPDWLTTRALGFASIVLGIILAGRTFAEADFVFSTTTNSLAQWLAIAYLGIVPTAWCSILRYRQIVAHGYTFVSYTGYIVPVMSIVLGHLFFSEAPPWELGLGLACILAGLALSRKGAAPSTTLSKPTKSPRSGLRASK